MKFAVVAFPGSSCDDYLYVLKEILKQEAASISHRDTSLQDAQCVILPGGSSYGDYLRPGALASLSPIMDKVREFAKEGGLVLGIGNGFQILLETGLLPGAMLPNSSLRFVCRQQTLKVENANTPFTGCYAQGQIIQMPIAHGQGNYYLDPASLKKLQENNQIVFRYTDEAGNATEEANPNGSVDNIAGIINQGGNVLGMMPHPERSCEAALGSTGGLGLFQSAIEFLAERVKA